MTPEQRRRVARMNFRLIEVEEELESTIFAEPTGEARNRLTDANILLKAARQHLSTAAGELESTVLKLIKPKGR